MNRRKIVLVAVLAVAALATGLVLRGRSARSRGEAALSYAVERLVARDIAEARRLAGVARAAIPESADAAFVAAAAEAAGGDLRAAYACAETAATLAPRDAEKALAAGLVAREFGRQTGNEVWPERARSWFDAAVARAEAAAESRPGELAPRLHVAAARLAAGETEEALAVLREPAPRTDSEREQVAVLRAAAVRARDGSARRDTGTPRPPTPSADREARTPRAEATPRGVKGAPDPKVAGTSAAAPDVPTASLEVRRGQAKSFLLFTGDRSGFDAALFHDAASTVVDSGGAFTADPTAATAQSSVTRTGTVAGEDFSYTAYDFDFSNAPTGTLSPGAAGGDVADTDNVNVERPATQGTAAGSGTWGLDGATGSTSTRNALLVDFTTTPGGLGIGHFGLDLIDFEASAAFTRGEIRLYDGGILVFSSLFDWAPSDGNNRVHFLGVVDRKSVV